MHHKHKYSQQLNHLTSLAEWMSARLRIVVVVLSPVAVTYRACFNRGVP